MIGRLIGWVLLATAFLMASAEAVMALGTGTYSGLATAEMLTLLSGSAPAVTAEATSPLATMANTALDMPAWVATAVVGLGFLVIFRRRRQRPMFRRSTLS